MRTRLMKRGVLVVVVGVLGTVLSAHAAESIQPASKTLECRGANAVCDNDKQCCSNRCILQVGGAYKCD